MPATVDENRDDKLRQIVQLILCASGDVTDEKGI